MSDSDISSDVSCSALLSPGQQGLLLSRVPLLVIAVHCNFSVSVADGVPTVVSVLCSAVAPVSCNWPIWWQQAVLGATCIIIGSDSPALWRWHYSSKYENHWWVHRWLMANLRSSCLVADVATKILMLLVALLCRSLATKLITIIPLRVLKLLWVSGRISLVRKASLFRRIWARIFPAVDRNPVKIAAILSPFLNNHSGMSRNVIGNLFMLPDFHNDVV